MTLLLLSLFIPVPPQKPTIFDGSGTELIGIAGPYNEGSSMSLTCVATGGKNIVFFPYWKYGLFRPNLQRHHMVLDLSYCTFELASKNS